MVKTAANPSKMESLEQFGFKKRWFCFMNLCFNLHVQFIMIALYSDFTNIKFADSRFIMEG